MKKLEVVARGGSWFAPIESEEAMLLVAQCLREGWLVIRDYNAALRWLRRAARVGSATVAGLLRDLEAE
ncbi:MAG TPA: SEL1-like repeat protein [Kofleriaceae bacterium]